jgi:hypothetical protein
MPVWGGSQPWLDPGSLLGEEKRRELDEDEGFVALFDSLRRSGPGIVPS